MRRAWGSVGHPSHGCARKEKVMKTQTKPDEQRQLPFGTRHNLDPFACLSALQKCIRRGVEREAMEFACELLHSTGTGPQFLTMVTNRLEIISHEDIDTQTQPHI